jgi:hypothetical protein
MRSGSDEGQRATRTYRNTMVGDGEGEEMGLEGEEMGALVRWCL